MRLELADLEVARGQALLRYAFLLCGDRSEAQDLVQEAFLSVLRRGGDPLARRIENLEGYLRSSIYHDCASRGRRLRRGREALKRLTGERDVVADSQETVASRDHLWSALQELPARQRAAIVLRFYEDLPDTEIGEVLGCATGTVRSLVHRGLTQLQRRDDLATHKSKVKR
ncbi:sigma-70 family RNA polymerase sigma factor [Nocardioides sp. JQ2195]|uniref:RNA polymerase sigma factor n=1 Tax=Nocardioides sp. JQ2195 TaxID=2592334 RepID=UPI001F0DCDF1|nr:sigma-70 family RNA polymerase sigma factor [Nocardioides sp. JQ2195]